MNDENDLGPDSIGPTRSVQFEEGYLHALMDIRKALNYRMERERKLADITECTIDEELVRLSAHVGDLMAKSDDRFDKLMDDIEDSRIGVLKSEDIDDHAVTGDRV